MGVNDGPKCDSVESLGIIVCMEWEEFMLVHSYVCNDAH